MDLNEASALAHELMSRHGLTDQGWRFRWDSARKRLGQCTYSTRTISMSRYMATEADTELVKQTLLHEVAHALTPGAKHSARWAAKAKEIGYTGARTTHNPYADKQDRLRLPPHLQSLEADVNLRAGQPGLVIRGTGIVGQQVRILRRNEKTYSIVMSDNRQYRIPKHAIAALPAGVEEHTDPVAEVGPRLGAGQNGIITLGKHKGAKVSIIEKRRTRYLADIEGMGRRLVPMEMVASH